MYGKLLRQAIDAYSENYGLLLVFSVPFLIALPLALFLPNYSALGGIFLRVGSLGSDLGIADVAFLTVALGVSLLLLSFALVAINSVIKAQRSFNKLKHTDFERMEEATFRLFAVLVIAFLAAFAFNLLLYQTKVLGEQARLVLNSLFTAAVSLLVLFAPQAIVLDNSSPENAFTLSASLLSKKWLAVALLLAVSAILLAVNFLLFNWLSGYVGFAALLGIAVNALFIVPFLEVVKVQIYLSKYNLL